MLSLSSCKSIKFNKPIQSIQIVWRIILNIPYVPFQTFRLLGKGFKCLFQRFFYKELLSLKTCLMRSTHLFSLHSKCSPQSLGAQVQNRPSTLTQFPPSQDSPNWHTFAAQSVYLLRFIRLYFEIMKHRFFCIVHRHIGRALCIPRCKEFRLQFCTRPSDSPDRGHIFENPLSYDESQ